MNTFDEYEPFNGAEGVLLTVGIPTEAVAVTLDQARRAHNWLIGHGYVCWRAEHVGASVYRFDFKLPAFDAHATLFYAVTEPGNGPRFEIRRRGELNRRHADEVYETRGEAQRRAGRDDIIFLTVNW